ncbi:MAG: MurT ligase domain-containing protein [Armatimonadota bacterium]|nr:MurT ligase domain-containing protein [Armatimonadota bacterium]
MEPEVVREVVEQARRRLAARRAWQWGSRLALALAPDLVPALARQLARGVVLISGTNGKTTTARLLGGIAEAAGLAVIHNRAGANLLSGIAAALVARSTAGGRVRGELGLFEVDEATVPAAVAATGPRLVVLLNLFRDQLDRYGEIDLLADRWRRALAHLPAGAAVVYNADDPLVAEVAQAHTGRRVAFGLETVPDNLPPRQAPEHAADSRYCYTCGRSYVYTLIALGHMGHYACPQCGTTRPPADVRVVSVRLNGVDGAEFVVEVPGGSAVAGAVTAASRPGTAAASALRLAVRTRLPGLYNVYDATAAAAAGLALGIDAPAVARGLGETAPAFGRGERVVLEGREAVMLLAKNPAGFNEVLRTVLLADDEPVVLIAINDLIADGRDISWLWDVDFELLRDRVRAAVVTGLRGEEMALRLKYAGVPSACITLERDGAQALAAALRRVPAGRRLYILPTYTAMLQLRGLLARQGFVRGFWNQ